MGLQETHSAGRCTPFVLVTNQLFFPATNPRGTACGCVTFLWGKGKLFTSSFDFSFSLFPFRSSLQGEMKQLQQITKSCYRSGEHKILPLRNLPVLVKELNG